VETSHHTTDDIHKTLTQTIEDNPVSQNNKQAISKLFSMSLMILLLLFIVAAGIWSTLISEQKKNTPPYLLVVPFSISSNNPDLWQPFTDQVTRELIQGLRKNSGVKTVPPPSSFTLNQTKFDRI
jgi:hypothetical protein